MIEAPSDRPIFKYAYRPLGCRRDLNDGGFSVTLCANDRLIFNQVDANMRSLQLLSFDVSPEIRANYYAMLDHADWWLNMTPQQMLTEHPAYTSMFGYEGHGAIIAHDLEETVQTPFLEPYGHYTRHLYAFHEDMADLLMQYGFSMRVRGFWWDSRVVLPTQQPSQEDGWAGRVVNF